MRRKSRSKKRRRRRRKRRRMRRKRKRRREMTTLLKIKVFLINSEHSSNPNLAGGCGGYISTRSSHLPN